jgi:PhnB protein
MHNEAKAIGVYPHLIINGAAKAIEFYKVAFNAHEIKRVPAEDGVRLMHAEIQIDGTTVYLCDDFPEYAGGKSRSPNALKGTPVTLHRYVPNCDEAVAKAHAAGAKIIMPPEDQFWGDRYALIEDPFGHSWSLATPLSGL